MSRTLARHEIRLQSGGGGDFNGDGYLDLFVANYDDVNELLLNDGTTGKQFVPSTTRETP